jgi:PAS domain S-box-containing protein
VETKRYKELPIDNSPILKSLLENSKVAGIFILDEHGTILRANPGALKYFGYTEEDVFGKNFTLLFTKEDKSAGNPEKELKEAIETGSGLDDNFIVHKNGNHLWCHGESILARDDKGDIFIFKIVFDIDKQRKLEEALFKKNNDLSNFIYTTSHDLKAPINNIEGLIDMLEEHKEISNQYSKEFEMLKSSIKMFKDVLNDLAEIGRVQEDGKGGVSRIEFKGIFEEIKWALNDDIKKSDATLFDDFSKAPIIDFSKKNLRSVFYNLISNAIKFRSPKRPPIVNVCTEMIGSEYIMLKVSDNGLGIKDEDKHKVFSLYGRLNPSIEGSGVGMAIVARIIDDSDGKIEIESEPGMGTTFKVYFKI